MRTIRLPRDSMTRTACGRATSQRCLCYDVVGDKGDDGDDHDEGDGGDFDDDHVKCDDGDPNGKVNYTEGVDDGSAVDESDDQKNDHDHHGGNYKDDYRVDEDDPGDADDT